MRIFIEISVLILVNIDIDIDKNILGKRYQLHFDSSFENIDIEKILRMIFRTY